MERLQKLINILKLTPHRQPELVKEAVNRILSRPIRSDPQAITSLGPLIEILLQYCDDNDSAQRSLFNDYLNVVILTFQQQEYRLIVQVLIDIVSANGTARTLTATLQRIPCIIDNVQPIELGCDHSKLIKSLIEVARRSKDESVQKALDSALKSVMPYLDSHIRKAKETLFHANMLVEVLFNNLEDESSQVKRLAASSLSTICSNSDPILQSTLIKLTGQLALFTQSIEPVPINKYVGFCLCVRDIPNFGKQHRVEILQMILDKVESNSDNATLVTASLETLRDLLQLEFDQKSLGIGAQRLIDQFLLRLVDDHKVLNMDIKIILQANALACLSVMMKQKPAILDDHESLLMFLSHPETVVRNQAIMLVGNYIEAIWAFPGCVDRLNSCEKVRRLWIALRSILYDESSHPDLLKSCAIATKTCINTLLESDHCLHIVEYTDFECFVHLYLKSNYKPFKVELLSLFANINYKALYYLERSHWSKMRAQTAGSLLGCLQSRIINEVVIESLIDEHQKIRAAAISSLIAMIPNLYITNINSGTTMVNFRSSDPIVSLAQDLSDKHLLVLKQADEHVNHFNNPDEPMMRSDFHEKTCIKNQHRHLSSSIMQSRDNPFNERINDSVELIKSEHSMTIDINLKFIVSSLKLFIENNLDKGKNAVSSIVKTLYEISLIYPIHQYASSWDCRPSEYCDCFMMLDFLLTYLQNSTEPDIVIEDLDSYKNFLAMTSQLLYALCHESVLTDYENQKMRPYHKRQTNNYDGYWSELCIKHSCIADILDTYLTHQIKLLWLCSCILSDRSNPFNITSKQPQSQQMRALSPFQTNHDALVTNRAFLCRIHRKLESSFRSSRKNLVQKDEKFYQILQTCLNSISNLLEFVSMSKSIDLQKDILGYLKITFQSCSIPSLICARQLLKSLFGINTIALYQVDPIDWFEDECLTTNPSDLLPQRRNSDVTWHTVYHHLITNPYKIFSSYYSRNYSQIAPASDEALSLLCLESRRALKVRRRIEDRIRSLFEHNPDQLIEPKTRQVAEKLKHAISEFTPIVVECMSQFSIAGFCRFQSETLHLMSYLILLRVNYPKLAPAGDLIGQINKSLDDCGEKVFIRREQGIEEFLRNSFTFLTLLSYERGSTQPMFQVATVIQKLDDLRAKLTLSGADAQCISTYVVPLLRVLVEDLFIYRTKQFQEILKQPEAFDLLEGDLLNASEQADLVKKENYETLEAERETVAQKLMDVIDNPRVYDLLAIIILESRQNLNQIKYKKLSQRLLSTIMNVISRHDIKFHDYRCIELTRIILENISPEVFHPISFIFETLLDAPKPIIGPDYQQIFKRWMSSVIISIHILSTQVREEVFLTKLRETMSDESFVEYLLHVVQLCISEILNLLYSRAVDSDNSVVTLLAQQLSAYLLYLTHMFQSGLFRQLTISASSFIGKEVHNPYRNNGLLKDLTAYARDNKNVFSLNVCERMFFYTRLEYPDLTIFWCNIMMLLNNVDCNREYWRNLLLYNCHQCQGLEQSMNSLSISSSLTPDAVDNCETHTTPASDATEPAGFRRSSPINRPSSLNLSDVSLSDQLRRSFMKRIAASESREKALNRNIIETSDEEGRLHEQEVSIGNIEQCLSPNIELSRRGTLCLVLDFVTISMNDVEHITWLIIHHINDIIRWSHETPITEFINAVHGNSASSGIFIQAINSRFNDLSSITLVTKLMKTLERVHYTQYGSLVVLLVEKLLSSADLIAYRSVTKSIERFACITVHKLLNETNKSLVATNDEFLNQLTSEDLDRIYSTLDSGLYPELSKLLLKLRETTIGTSDVPEIELPSTTYDSDDDSEKDEMELLHSKANLIYWLADQNCTSHISTLIPAINTIKMLLSDSSIVERVNKDQDLVCQLISVTYSLALNHLPPPTRFLRPKFWSNSESGDRDAGGKSPAPAISKPMLKIESKRPVVMKVNSQHFSRPADSKTKTLVDDSKKDVVETVRLACLKALFLYENLDFLRVSQVDYLEELVIRLVRLSLVNSFVLTPPILWRSGVWPTNIDDSDKFKTNFHLVTYEHLCKDYGIFENFCDRLLRLGWTNRRQFEEMWMTLLGVLSSSLSQPQDYLSHDQKANFHSSDAEEKKRNLLIACKAISTITKLVLLTKKIKMGDPLSRDSCPVQSFDERVIELTKAIATNLTSLRKKTQEVFDQIESDRKLSSNGDQSHASLRLSTSSISTQTNGVSQLSNFSHHLSTSAQKLRMNVILNAELNSQDTVVINSDGESVKFDDVDIESCIRLLLSLYRQKFKDPDENPPLSQQGGANISLTRQYPGCQNQLAPPLAATICQSIMALSDLFTDFEQFDWLFDTFIFMFRHAERNEDEIIMQYLILGLCKAVSVCCYEIPNEIASSAAINHRDVMFEKCRQSIERCIKSDFGPLKCNALFGVYYMLEDSINIVASGAWELDHFKQLRQSRLNWIFKLVPILIGKDGSRENMRCITKKPHVMALLECLCSMFPSGEQIKKG